MRMILRLRTLLLSLMATMLLSLPISAFAGSSLYYAKTAIYFNIPTDATFSIAMPNDYTSFDAISGTTEGGATATDWISFNFTSGAASGTLVQPYQLGASADTQAGEVKPIFYIDNTGNTGEKFTIRYDAEPQGGYSVFFNASCGGPTAPACAGTETVALTNMSTSYQVLTTELETDEYLNITLYANNSVTQTAGQTTINLYINSTAV